MMNVKILLKLFVVTLIGSALAGGALAQWQWIDKDGRKVFSDRSPPTDIQEKNILKRPPGVSRIPPPEAAAGDTAGSNALAPQAKTGIPKISGKDTELEAKKKLADQEDAAKKKLEEEKVAKARADNCNRAKQTLVTLQSGSRLSSVNAKGEREIYDDAKRASEVKRTQDIIDASCT